MKVLENFQDARVERRGSYQVLRVGDFGSYSEAKGTLSGVKRYYKDAYIRKCDIDYSTFVYPTERNREEEKTAVVKRVPQQRFEKVEVIKPERKRVEKKARVDYYQPEVRDSMIEPSSLYKDCSNCFAPIYQDEVPEEVVEEKREKELKAYKNPNKTLKKYPKSSSSSENDFWANAVDDIDERDKKVMDREYSADYYPKVDANLPP